MDLDPGGKEPLYEQIYAYIKADIQHQRLPFEEKLPSTRMLAGYLQVSRTTVAMAYDQLLSEGYIESIPCKGYYVCRIEELYNLGQPPGEEPEGEELSGEQYAYDFCPDGIDAEHFPFPVWRKLFRAALCAENRDLFSLGPPKGASELRRNIASYLHQARGVNCAADQIVVGAGNDYLLMLLGKLLGGDHRIAMEDPTYRQAWLVFRSMGYPVDCVPMDQGGMDVDALKRTVASLAYVMPSHQFPLGTVMPISRRLKLLNWAGEREGRYIIEDDYDSEFRYRGKPIPALAGYDVNDRVIYLGTFSKSIAPALRVSYMALPKHLARLFDREFSFFNSTVPGIDQAALNAFIQEGHYEKHLNKMRGIYKNRHDILLGEMKKLESVCRVFGEHAGLHILAEFYNGMSEAEIIAAAGARGIRLYGLSDYQIGGGYRGKHPVVLMGYGKLAEGQIVRAVRLLREIFC